MKSNETYEPGRVILEKLVLTNFDGSKSEGIDNFAVDINIYEDIFQCQIFGEVLIRDTKELIEFFPIVGDETLDIRFRVPTRDDSCAIDFKKMRVYKIADRSATGKDLGKVQTYKLYFFSPELLTSMNSRVSRSFSGGTASDITKNVFDDYMNTTKTIDIEPTEGDLKMVIPNWAPLRTISWLATTKAINVDKQCDFLFFESSNKSAGPIYSFKSITSMMKQKASFELKFSVQNMNKNGVKDLSTVHNNIENFTFDNHGSVLDNTLKGQYNQTWIYHDPLRKRFVVSKPDHEKDYLIEPSDGSRVPNSFYTDVTKKQSSPMQFLRMPGGINSFPVKVTASKAVDNDVSTGCSGGASRSDSEYISDKELQEDTHSSLIPDHAHKRSFKLQQMNNFKLVIASFPGTDEIQLGKMIKFTKPHITFDSNMVSNKVGRFDDKFVSGNYLVTRLRHRIHFETGKPYRKYTMSIELVKDSFNVPITSKTISDN
jgi:hypothetical protein